MKKLNKFILASVISAICSFNAFASNGVLSNRMNIGLDGSGQLSIQNEYLTNYVFKGVDPATGEEGPFQLIKPNNQILNLDLVDIEWEGIFPKVDLKFDVSQNAVETKINLTNYQYPNSVQWNNSNIVLQGASLVDLVVAINNENLPKEQWIETLVLFLLNSLTLVENGMSVVQNLGELKAFNAPDLLTKLKPLAEKISDYKSQITKAGLISDLSLVNIEIAQAFLDATGAIEKSKPYLERLIEYNKTITIALGKLQEIAGHSEAITYEKKSEIRGTIANQFSTMLGDISESGVEAVIEQTAQQFAVEYVATSSDEKKAELVGRYLISPFAETFHIYKNLLENELIELKDANAEDSTIEEKQDEIDFFINGRAILILADFLFATPDIIEVAKTDPERFFTMLRNLASAVASALYKASDMEVIAKKVWQNFSGLDGRGSSFHTIRSVIGDSTAYMNAIQTGEQIGNTLIPFIWDIVLAPNRLSSSIVNSNISAFGVLETEVLIQKINDDGSKTRLATANALNPSPYIYLEPQQTIEIAVGLKRPLQFDPERAPWKLNISVAPMTLYQTNIITSTGAVNDFMCVRKLLGNTDFVFYERESNGASSSNLSNLCGGGTLLGGDWFKNQAGANLYNLNEIPEKLTLKAFDTESNPISSYEYTYQSGIDDITVLAYAFDANSALHNIKIVPAIGNLESAITQYSDPLNPDITVVQIDLSSLGFQQDNSMTVFIWNWGDGSEETTTGDMIADHTYETKGDYLITLTVATESGEEYSYQNTIAVGGASQDRTLMLNDTGLTWGGDYPDGNNSTCIGENIASQDCSHGRDVTHNDDSDGHAGFSYTRLLMDGSEYQGSGNYNVEQWSCVRDNVTGLIWEVKTLDGGIHDASLTYRWGGVSAQKYGNEFYPDWDELVNGANEEKLCGFSDWRVPFVSELFGIINFSQESTSIDTMYFPNTLNVFFWSSDPSVKYTSLAWFVGFAGGLGTMQDERLHSASVRLVRGGE